MPEYQIVLETVSDSFRRIFDSEPLLKEVCDDWGDFSYENQIPFEMLVNYVLKDTITRIYERYKCLEQSILEPSMN